MAHFEEKDDFGTPVNSKREKKKLSKKASGDAVSSVMVNGVVTPVIGRLKNNKDKKSSKNAKDKKTSKKGELGAGVDPSTDAETPDVSPIHTGQPGQPSQPGQPENISGLGAPAVSAQEASNARTSHIARLFQKAESEGDLSVERLHRVTSDLIEVLMTPLNLTLTLTLTLILTFTLTLNLNLNPNNNRKAEHKCGS